MSNPKYTFRFIKSQLDSIEQDPLSWGNAAAVEAQYVLLLQLYVVASIPWSNWAEPNYVRDLYSKYKKEKDASSEYRSLASCSAKLVQDLSGFRSVVEYKVQSEVELHKGI